MKKNVLIFCVLLPLLLYGQSRTIQGNVIDQKGNTLAYANVYLEGSLDGSTTDQDGNFSFTTKKTGTYTLVCNYMGFEDYRTKIQIKKNRANFIEIILIEKPLKSETVMVTASAFTSGEEEGVTLTPLEVVTTPGAAADIFWAIKSYPGVQQVDEGAGLFVRGGDVSETAVILDGAYLNHPYRYESPNGGFFGTITPFLLKGTYFSSGGYGAEYGNALSGALIMESMDMPVRDNYNIGVGLAALSGALAKIIIPNKFSITMSGNYSDTETMFNLNNNRQKFSRFPKAYDININTIYKYSSRGSLKLFLFREVDEIGIEVKNPEHGGYYEGDGKNSLINLKWKYLLNSSLLLQGNLAFSKFQNNQRLNILDLETDESQHQLRISAEYNFQGNFKIKSGFEAFNTNVGLKGKVPVDYSDLDPNAPSNRVSLDYLSRRGSAFIQSEISFNNDLQIVPGIRTEYESNLGKVIFDPRISLTYKLKENLNLTLAAGKYHQFPEPYYYDSYVGNPKLGSMNASHYIAGLIYQKENTILRLEGYYKDYTDLVLEDKLDNYSNKGHGCAKGFDLFLKHSYGILNGRISYSYLVARRQWMDAPKISSPDFDITHNLNTVLQATLSGHFQIGLAYRVSTGKPYTSGEFLYNDSRVPDYQKLDLNASYLYRFFDGNLTIFYIGIANLLGRDNIFDYYYSPDHQKRDAVKSSMLRSVYFGFSFIF